MATYFQGSYLPAYKEFTPDYQFLASALQTRQAKYEAGHKALSDAYGKVVYGDLSRKDSNEIRDYYANDLSKQLEKAAQSDLSLGQNIDSAQNLFKPFYENDLIVKDLSFTKKYKQLMSDAEYFKSSTDPKVKDKYWTTGVEAMKFQMEDFLNADKETAIGMGMPSYVENPNLFKRVSEYFKDYKVDVKRDLINPSNPSYIITAQNGEQIKGDLYSLAQQVFMNDPNIQQAYYTDAYVKSRKFAKSAVESGMFNSEDEAKEAWATETISRIEDYQNEMLKKDKADLSLLKSVNVNWQNYEKTNTKPLTDEEVEIKNSIEDRYKQTIEKINSNAEKLASPVSNQELNTTDKLNKAYNLLTNYNLQNELFKASDSYSKLHSSTTFEVNPLELENLRHAHNLEAIAIKDKLEKEKKENDDDDLFGKRMGLNVSKTKLGTLEALTNEKGNLETDADIIAQNEEDFVVKFNNTFNNQIDDAVRIYEKLFPRKEDYTFNDLEAKSIVQLKEVLKDPKNSKAAADFISHVSELSKNASTINPNAVDDSFLASIRNLRQDTKNVNTLMQQKETFNDLMVKNLNDAITLGLVDISKEYKEFYQNNKELLFTKENGKQRLRTLDEFEKALNEKYPNSERFYKPEFKQGKKYVPANVGTMYTSSLGVSRTPEITREKAEKSEVQDFYETTKNIINKTLNGSFNVAIGENYFKTFNYKEANIGKSVDEMQPTGGTINPYYSASISDPYNLSVTKDEAAVNLLTNFKNQLENTPESELRFIEGDLAYQDQDSESSETARSLAYAILNASGNERLSKILPPFEIGYSQGYGNQSVIDKQEGAYVITFYDTKKELNNFYDKEARDNKKAPTTITVTFPKTKDRSNLNMGLKQMSNTEYVLANSESNSFKEVIPKGGEITVYFNSDKEIMADLSTLLILDDENKIVNNSINLTAEAKKRGVEVDDYLDFLYQKIERVAQQNSKK